MEVVGFKASWSWVPAAGAAWARGTVLLLRWALKAESRTVAGEKVARHKQVQVGTPFKDSMFPHLHVSFNLFHLKAQTRPCPGRTKGRSLRLSCLPSSSTYSIPNLHPTGLPSACDGHHNNLRHTTFSARTKQHPLNPHPEGNKERVMMPSSLFGVRNRITCACMENPLVHLRQGPPCPAVWIKGTIEKKRCRTVVRPTHHIVGAFIAFSVSDQTTASVKG